MPSAPTFAFLGCGNMGMAVLRGALHHGVLQAADTLVVDASAERRAEARGLGAHVSDSVHDARSIGRVMLAVKPQHFEAVAAALRGDAPIRRLVISVMAGWSASSIAIALGDASVVRTMPNLPAQIGMGMTAIAAAPDVAPGDLAFIERLFEGVGRTVRVHEDQLDAVTAVSGSGPAYLFLLAEAEIAAAKDLGLDDHTAHALVTQTLLGAATMLSRSVQSPADLRVAVTSKGGTTEAALHVLENARLRETVAHALAAARDRGAALGR
ncbi:MAG: pyrroline-5-carboxylate reductase [Phycisphaerae bacterium]|nr:pyrroline-5-carboxylate reductase [Phycisphaerae bacterium]